MKAKNIFIRFFSFVLAIASVAGPIVLFTSTSSVSAAADTEYVIPGEYRLESAARSKVMINLYGNRNANCTKVCAWTHDNSVEQIISVVYEGNGAYRLYFRSHSSRCVDILRYSSALKKGMKVELYDDNDDVAQLVIPYRVNSQTVIWRMRSDPSLAISLNGTKNGTQLVLSKFDPKNKNQQFVFRSADKSFKRVSAFSSSEPLAVSKALNCIPSTYYKVSSVYTVSGKSYRYCITTKKYGGVGKNTPFYQTSSGKLVTDKALYRKLETITLLNSVRRETLKSIRETRECIILTNDCCAAFERNKQFTKLLGTAGGAGLRAVFGCSKGKPITSLYKCGVTIAGAMIEPETSLGYVGIVLLKAISSNGVYYCDSAISLLSSPFTDYSRAIKAIEAVAEAKGHYYAAMAFGKPLLKKIASSNGWKTTAIDLTKALVQGATGCDDIPALEIYSMVENARSVADLFGVFKMDKAYEKAYANVIRAYKLG